MPLRRQARADRRTGSIDGLETVTRGAPAALPPSSSDRFGEVAPGQVAATPSSNAVAPAADSLRPALESVNSASSSAMDHLGRTIGAAETAFARSR
jgi:hypothetical protein